MSLTEDRNDPNLKKVGTDGQNVTYLVKPEVGEFVQPVRNSYKHIKCGEITSMGDRLAETYARDPHFYGSTFCCSCRSHYPVGPLCFGGEFYWKDTDQPVGTTRIVDGQWL